jgi:redox-sensing transcriptional repressor
MPKKETISLSVIRRLPRYYRFLGEIKKSNLQRISSAELSKIMGLTASQIRQDLNCFGGFGQQGYGYNVSDLYEQIGKILGLDKKNKTILIGAGNLGKTISTQMGFSDFGFDLVGIFDISPDLIGTNLASLTVKDVSILEEFCEIEQPKVACLCIPKEAAEEIAERLVKLGIRGFWNFSHYDMSLEYKGIVVENVHLGDSLMTLGYRVNENL